MKPLLTPPMDTLSHFTALAKPAKAV